MKLINNFKFFILIFLILNLKALRRELVLLGSGLGSGIIGSYLYNKKNDITDYFKEKTNPFKGDLEDIKYIGEGIKDRSIELKNEIFDFLKSEGKYYFNNPVLLIRSNQFKNKILTTLKLKEKAETININQCQYLKLIFGEKKLIIDKENFKSISLKIEELSSKNKKNKFKIYKEIEKLIIENNKFKEINEKTLDEIKKMEIYSNEEKIKKIFPEK